MTFRALCALAVAGLAAAASSSRASITLANGQTALLSDVLGANNPDHQVNIGDKTFTFITYTSVNFPATGISVVGFIAPNPLQGTGFDLTGGFGDTVPNDAAASEFNIRYSVEVQPGFIAQGYRITDAGLSFNGAASGAGSYARVDESLFDVNGVPGANLITNASAFAFGSGTPAAQLQDSHVFGLPGYTKIEVDKDVQFFAFGPNGTATASFVRQTFSQTVVPGPGALALVGLAGMIAGRRRRQV